MEFPEGKFLIDIHNHLSGSFSETLLESIAVRKGINLEENFKEWLMEYKSVDEFDDKWAVFSPIFSGDSVAVEELVYDCIKRCAESGIVYLETRICTFLFTSQSPFYKQNENFKPDLNTQREALDVVKKAIRRAMEDFPILVKIILVAVRTMYKYNAELTELLSEDDKLIVGVDTAGDESAPMSDDEYLSLKSFYQTAAKHNLGRTCHAGETSGVESIVKAIEEFNVQRIGHGYSLINDEQLAKDLKQKDIHFELCPVSSVMIQKNDSFKDMKTTFNWFFDQDLNVSLNSDDSMFFNGVDVSIKHCHSKFNIDDKKILKALLDSARSSFLNDNDKKKLIDHIKNNFKLNII